MKNVFLATLFLFSCWQAGAQDYLKEAKACFEKGDYECAKKNYSLFQIWNGNNMSAEIQQADECLRTLHLADDYFKENEYSKARDRYKAVLEKNPHDSHAKKQFEACEKLLAPVATTLTVSRSDLSFTSTGGAVPIRVTTNADGYEVSSLPDWCSAAGKTSDGFTLQCKAWGGNVPREASFFVKANDLSEKINVHQAAAPRQQPKTEPAQPAKTESAPETRQPRTNADQQTASTDDKFKKNTLGLDVGIGARKVNEWAAFPELGLRWSHRFSPRLGWDVVNIKMQAILKEEFSLEDCLLQGMTGVRAFSPAFTNNLKGYAALKVGVGYQPHLAATGFAGELEIGLQPVNTLCIGFVVNLQNLKGSWEGSDFKLNSAFVGVRTGFFF